MTVTIENLYTGNNSTTNYSFTFPYLDEPDIKASLDGVVTTNFRLLNATTVQFVNNTTDNTPTAPGTGVAIRIYRETAYTNPKATFYPGAAIRAGDLNDNTLQNLYVTQEANDKVNDAWLTGDPTVISTETWYTTDDTKIATTKAIENRIDTKIDTALTTDVVGGQSITVTDDSPSTGKITVAVTATSIDTAQLATGAVTKAKIGNDQIDSEHYIAGSIDNEHLADDAVGIDELAADAVVNASVKSDAAIEFTKLENLDSAKILVGNASNKAAEVSMSGDVAISNTGATTIQTGAVEHAMLSGDCIDGDNIEDNAIDSEHYAAGSIDTEHIANANVTLAKIEDLADTKIIVGNGSNRPTAVSVSGDVTIANTGAVTIATDAINANKIANNAVTTDHIQDAELTTLAGMPSATASRLADSTALTASTAELNILDNKTFRSSGDGSLTTTSDTEIPSSKVIAAHVSSTILATGGFISINNEVSFPTTANQPANGVIVSISDAAGTVINGSGTSTTGRTTDGTPATVTINNFPSSLNGETLATGVGMLVTSTGSSNIYNYHKILAAEADVKQLSDDINDFNARYRVAGSAPGSNNDAGDMYFDTSANKMKVYNGTTSTWDDVASVGNFYINTLSSSSGTGGGSATFNGSAYRFQLSNAPTMAQQLIVSVNGVIQKPDAGTGQPSEGFAINGNDIIFSAAPASGSDYFIVTQGSSVSIGTPSDNTVSTAKIQNLAVNDAKIANNTIEEVSLKISNTPSDGKFLQYKDSSDKLTWATVNTDVVGDTTPQLGGNLDVNGKNIIFDDSSDGAADDVLKFGTGTDLSIYSDGNAGVLNGDVRFLGQGQNIEWDKSDNLLWFKTNTNGGQSAKAWWGDGISYGNLEIFKSGSSGPAIIQTQNIDLQIASGNSADVNILTSKDINFINSTNSTNYYMRLKENSGSDQCVELYYGNTPDKKLETTNTGVTVTGNVNVTGEFQVNGSTLSSAPEITATASGAIAQHKAVGVNSNGTISDIKVTINVLSTPTATSSERLYDDASSWYNTVAYDPDKDVILAGWWDSWKFRVACGRMAADGSITWAPRQTAANSANVKFYSACYNADRKCFVLAYKYGTSDTSPTQIQVATVNSETLVLTWQGSPTSISNGSTYKEEDQTIVYDSSSKACIVGVRENATPYKTQAWIVNISDSYGISYSDTNGQLANNYAARPDFCMGANRNFMSSWQAETDSDKIMVSLKTLNTSGAWTSNTAVAYEVADPSGNVEWTSIAYDPNADKYIVAWSVPTDSNKLFACTLTVTGSAGSESISKGTTVEVSSGTNRHDLAFDSTINKMACRYLNDSMYLRLKYLTISGTNITVGNEVSINGNNDAHGSNDEGWTQSIVHCDTAQRMFLIHSRGQDSNYVGYSTVSGGTSTNNLSSFIGYANTAIADTASGAVAVTGNVNEGQSGLTAGTKYYLQKDGSLSTTADTPSVEAGMALSATKLLIKG